jgi:CDP-diacylglycerol--glycerol-3-phosphate 3-phosphatidyltransferase
MLSSISPFNIRQDEDITAAVLGEPSDDPFPRGETWLASGYLNLPDRFENAITHAANAFAHGSARTHLLSAAPQANGWYGAKGIGGKVPSLYAAVEYHMLRRLSERHNHTVRSNVRFLFLY